MRRYLIAMKFLKNFKNGEMVYLEDSVLWYCLEMSVDGYKRLSIHQRINFKQSFFDMSERLYKEINSINY